VGLGGILIKQTGTYEIGNLPDTVSFNLRKNPWIWRFFADGLRKT